MPFTIAITGATGFIGKAICLHLARQGHMLRALVRSPSLARDLTAARIKLVAGSLGDPAALKDLVSGADAVIHCAGSVRGRSPADFEPANVDGSRNLLTAISQQPKPARLLAFSSLTAREPALSWYAASKKQGEQVLINNPQACDWTIFRPPAVYGPGDKEMLPLLRLMQRGYAVTPGASTARVSLIYIDDLVNAVCAWLETPLQPGQLFYLSDPTTPGYSWGEIAGIAQHYFGRKVRLIQIPRVVLDTVARCNLAAASILDYQPMLTPAKLRELRHANWVCSSVGFSQATGWQPKVDLRLGLEKTFAV